MFSFCLLLCFLFLFSPYAFVRCLEISSAVWYHSRNPLRGILMELQQKAHRNYGIDLLRIVCMLYVVIVHCLGYGGGASSVTNSTFGSAYLQLLSTLSFCAVNIFGIISGYVGYREQERSPNYAGFILLWLQVLFYNVGITLVFDLIDSDYVYLRYILSCFTPIAGTFYWYITAYSGVYLLMPLLNAAVRNTSEQSLKKILLLFFLVFSVYAVWNDFYDMQDGFSMSWLMLMYIVGASLKKCKPAKTIPAPVLLVGILICTVVTAVLRTCSFSVQIFALEISINAFYSYMFPTHLINAVCHVLLFEKISVSPRMYKWLHFATPGALAIYMLNTHELIWQHVVKDSFRYLADASLVHILLDVPIFACCFSIVALFIDWLRRKLFELLHIPQLANRLAASLNKLLDVPTLR